MGCLFIQTHYFPLPLPPTTPVRVCCCCSYSNQHDLKGQTVAVVGLGVSGRAATKLALARGASVLSIDKNEQLVQLEHDPEFSKHTDLQTFLGDGNIPDLAIADRVVVSPGVPLQKYGLSTLLQSGRQVMSELDFAAEVLPQNIKVLAVTGTNGKSTVTSYAGQVAVVEVSSSQMEIPTSHFSASVAVALNLTPDHLEWHKTMQNYAHVKCHLFSHMKDKKLAVLPPGNPYLNEAFSKYASGCNLARIGEIPGIKVDVGTKIATLSIPTTGLVTHLQLGALKTKGSHNYSNAAVAAFLVLGLDMGINIDAISSTIEILQLLPHRVQVVCTDVNGVTWVDDSKATNVESTYTGIVGLKDHRLVVLLGGIAKVLDEQGSNGFEQIVPLLSCHKCVITFGDSGMKIYETLCNSGVTIPCMRAINLEEAVNCARSMASSGDTILLSPGCASYDEFRNFEHRGEVFQKLARS